jgi:hypothetical protein
MKCGQCIKKAVVRIKLGDTDNRWLCLKHYNIYMEAGKEYPPTFKLASSLLFCKHNIPNDDECTACLINEDLLLD